MVNKQQYWVQDMNMLHWGHPSACFSISLYLYWFNQVPTQHSTSICVCGCVGGAPPDTLHVSSERTGISLSVKGWLYSDQWLCSLVTCSGLTDRSIEMDEGTRMEKEGSGWDGVEIERKEVFVLMKVRVSGEKEKEGDRQMRNNGSHWPHIPFLQTLSYVLGGITQKYCFCKIASMVISL